MSKKGLRRILPSLSTCVLLAATASGPAWCQGLSDRQPAAPSIVHKVRSTYERIQMTVNTSRRLELTQKIPDAQVNNPDLLQLTPLSPNIVQISAKAPGVTQVNLWGEDKQIYTIDVIIYGDAQELAMLLQSQFPNTALRVIPVNNGVLISGYVDQPGHIELITRIAEEYYPKVINNITVSGTQQVLLHVKVMEVSRTKLRTLGFDFANFTSGNDLIASGISGLLLGAEGPDPAAGTLATVTSSGNETFVFNILEGGNAFFGLLEALREDKLAKVLAEPTVVAVSGRAAYFKVGGEIGYVESVDDQGRAQVGWKDYGTRLHFVPLVLGNGRIRLEVRPWVSELDRANGVGTIPAIKDRIVDTAVELQAGQTLALAGLVQNRVEAENRGLPLVSEVPYVGALFRRVEEKNNEVELLILVTPELVEAMDAHEVPPCGPGMATTSPDDCDLYMKGHLEVPNCCPPFSAAGPNMQPYPAGGPIGEGLILDEVGPEMPQPPTSDRFGRSPAGARVAAAPSRAPSAHAARPQAPQVRPIAPSSVPGPPPARPSISGKPSASHNRYSPSNMQGSRLFAPSDRQNTEPGFIGPVGYDVIK